MAQLTPLSKVLILTVVVGGVGFAAYKMKDKIAPPAQNQVTSNVPPTASLPGGQGAGTTAATPKAMPVGLPPGCTDKPEVRFFLWAWNAQTGLMHATGGKQSTADSLMCKNGVNLKLIREDNTDNMQAFMMSFAERHKAGEAHPKEGAHFVAIMGDGGANFLKGLNDRLVKLGDEYLAVVVGSAGYSRGEDKFMGPPQWKANPQAARGGLVAGYLRDGDWNIALKWLGDNQIPNNPDEKTYDPSALNWVAASDYLDAAEKYISGYCEERKNTQTGKVEKYCVQGAVTWTPGDVNIATKKGGLVSIVSTREYRSQMPNVIIGHKVWMSQNRELVKGMLRATFEGGDQVKADPAALRHGAEVSALVYNEGDADYWVKYFNVVTETDKQGLEVELGGSSVNNLADNLQTFGLVPGSTNLFAATYEVFANIVRSQYPDLLPTWYPAARITDTSYIQELLRTEAPKTAPDLPKFEAAAPVKQIISRRSWQITFESGSARFSGSGESELSKLLDDLVIAGGTIVEVHGHTDNKGSLNGNQALSEERAFAVKGWLEQQSATNFPQGRVRVHAHGQSEPLESNTTEIGRSKNRRVEVVLGTN